MLEHRQVNSATELALLLVENYTKTDAPVNSSTTGELLPRHPFLFIVSLQDQ
jgi:hypothetical protein